MGPLASVRLNAISSVAPTPETRGHGCLISSPHNFFAFYEYFNSFPLSLSQSKTNLLFNANFLIKKMNLYKVTNKN
jgi:hypothetical protein